MDPNTVYHQLQQLVGEQLAQPAESIGRSLALDELGLDSVEKVELMARVEETFEVAIPPADAVHLETIDDLIRYLSGRAA